MAAWDRQDGETAKGYRAFCAYLGMGSGRSVDASYNRSCGEEIGTKLALGYWREWCAAHDWPERAAAYDADIERQARAKADRETVNRRARMLTQHRQAGELLLARGTERILKHGVQSDKSTITAIKTGVDITRQAEGLPTLYLEIATATEDDLDRISDRLFGNRGEEAAPGHRGTPGGTAELVGTNGHAHHEAA